MNNELIFLILTSASVGIIHTILGPDHYLPFIALAKAYNWSIKKTILITFLCGLGHILSSVALGIVGLLLGITISNLETIDSIRGEIAAWLLIGSGLAYIIYGIKKIIRKIPHRHHYSNLSNLDPSVNFKNLNSDSREIKDVDKRLTPWLLFLIFVFGPCEALIPILMYPAAVNSIIGMILVTSVFGIVTIATMITVVITTLYGLNFLRIGKFEKYTYVSAGFVIFICGIAIKFWGL
jgi:sulfite exporter TauE/SafE